MDVTGIDLNIILICHKDSPSNNHTLRKCQTLINNKVFPLFNNKSSLKTSSQSNPLSLFPPLRVDCGIVDLLPDYAFDVLANLKADPHVTFTVPRSTLCCLGSGLNKLTLDPTDSNVRDLRESLAPELYKMFLALAQALRPECIDDGCISLRINYCIHKFYIVIAIVKGYV